MIWLISALGCEEKPLHQAAALAAKGQKREAAIAYRALAKLDPANLAAWDGAIDLFCRDLADVGECLSTLELELDLLGNLKRHQDVLGEVLERRARARLESGMLDAALADIDRGLKVAPDRAGFHLVRARVFLARGELEAARAAIERVALIDPGNTEAKQIVDDLFPKDGDRAPSPSSPDPAAP